MTTPAGALCPACKAWFVGEYGEPGPLCYKCTDPDDGHPYEFDAADGSECRRCSKHHCHGKHS